MSQVAAKGSSVDRERYRRDGIVFPIPVLSEAETRRFRAESDLLEQRLGGKPRTVEVRQMHLHFPWAYELAVHPEILDAVEDVLGPNILVWATELFTKHPHDQEVSIGWHRDRPYMGFEGGETVTAWVALADSIPTNGCLRAIPEVDRRPSERPSQGQHAKLRPTAVEVDEEKAIDVVLKAGEMSLHDADIIHGSGPNQSDLKRVGFVIRYVTPEVRPREGRPLAVLVRGEDTRGYFEPVRQPVERDAEEALRSMQESARQHFEAMLANVKARRR